MQAITQADKAAVPGLGYDERADHHSWADMLALLRDTIG